MIFPLVSPWFACSEVIAEALMSNRTLTCINLSYNKIWPHGAQVCQHPPFLKSIILVSKTPAKCFQVRFAQAIAAALRANYCLTDIILRGNFVEDEGAKA